MKAFKTALINIRRFPLQSFEVIFLITLTFFLGYIFSFLMIISEKVIGHFETVPQVIAFFEIDAEDSAINNAVTIMESKEYVSEVTKVTKEDALDIYVEGHQDDPLLLELVTSDILPASVEVAGTDLNSLDQIKTDLEQVEGIDEIVYQREVVDQIKKWTQIIRVVGLTSITALGVTSFLLMIITISLKAASRKRTIGIMKIIGATKGYISKPFMYEGIIYGLVSSVIGWVSAFLLLLYATPNIKSFLSGMVVLPLSTNFYLYQAGIGTFIGIIFGSLASILAVRRMLQK